MKKLLLGIVDFRKNKRDSVKDVFAALALGQAPDTIFIGCSDSRVVPNLFASSDPGDLFVIRNLGNLVAPNDHRGFSASDESEAAVIEFALLNLPITEIVVCGHSECGAMNLLSKGRQNIVWPAVKNWLRHGDASVDRLNSGAYVRSDLARHNILSQLNVLEQLENLRTYPIVKERIDQGRLRLHAWWFDIKEADVYEHDSGENRYHLIDEEYAKVLLGRDPK